MLTDPNYPENPTAAARAYWIRTHKEIAPNGSLMRTIPVGIVCMNMSEAETFSNAIALGAVTHTDPRCAVAVAAVSGLVRGLLRGEVKTGADVNALVERAYAASPPNPPKEPFDLHAYADSLDALKLDYGRIGYVYKAFGAALWCLREVLDGRETYKSAILKVVRTGGDADTNATVAGGLLGAICGYNALPPEWRDGLEHREWYLQKIDNLCITLGLLEGKYDAEADPDTAFA